MTRIRRSLAFSYLDRYAVMGLNLLTMSIMARLLTPNELGVFVVGAAIVLAVEVLRDFGTSVYLIQEREITPESVRTTFTVTAGLSVLIVLVLNGLAEPLARYYEDPRLSVTIRLASASILIGPFVAPLLALLRRDMAFGVIAIVNIVVAVVNCVVAVALAALGLGYLSLALAALAASVAGAVALTLHRPRAWIYRPCLVDWRKVLAFGGWSCATALLNVVYQMLPQLVLGRAAGFAAAGLYNQALMICQLSDRLILGAVQPVILPAFSDDARRGEDLGKAYLRAIGLISAVQWPALIGIAALAEPIVAIILGPQWAAAAPLVRILAVAALFGFAGPLTWPVLVSLGHVRDALTVTLIALPVSAVIVIAAASAGPQAAAVSMLVTVPLQLLVAITMIRRRLPLGWGEIAAALRPSVVVAVLTGIALVASLLLPIPAEGGAILRLLVSGGSAAAGWILGLILSRHPLGLEIRSVARAVFASLRTRSRTQETP